MSQTKVIVVEMARHFLYLPLYYARSKAYFGLLPAEYSVEIVDAPIRTDEGAYDFLLQNNANIAICDPTVVLKNPAPGVAPQILAGLITNAAFWAVDHKQDQITHLSDLARFEEIISFSQGTTSHGIASRIVRESNPLQRPKIRQVQPDQELVALEGQARAVALSPNVLEIEHLLESNPDLAVKLALSTTVEYANVLVTAVVASRRFVREHPVFVEGFIEALQRAMLHILIEDPDVIAFAQEAFNKPESIVKSALARANDAQVYPPFISVTEAQWLNAAAAYAESMGTRFDEELRSQAHQFFTDNVEPHTKGIRKLVKQRFLEGFVKSSSSLQIFEHAKLTLAERLYDTLPVASIAALVSLVIGASLPRDLSVSAMPLGYGVMFYIFYRFDSHRLLEIAHWVCCVIMSVLVYFFLRALGADDALWQLWLGLLATCIVGDIYALASSNLASRRIRS